jgi:hypothetical protein
MYRNVPPPVADAGVDTVIATGTALEFWGVGTSADEEITEYRWDFDEDGDADVVSPRTGFATYSFDAPGHYRCRLTVTDASGRKGYDCRVVKVVDGCDSPRVTDTAAGHAPQTNLGSRRREPDCVCHRYAIIMNSGTETRFRSTVADIYSLLTSVYGFIPTDVYLLDHWAPEAEWQTPNGMVDADVSTPNRAKAFEELARRVDGDDEVYVWIIGHGRGYESPDSRDAHYAGWLTGRASVDPGDEEDYPESDFKLRVLHTGGRYGGPHGLNVWSVYYEPHAEPLRIYRNKYVSQLAGTYVEDVGDSVYDEDVLIERLIDYTLGDLNRDGRIDADLGETLDWDGDGEWAFNPATGAFDEDEWGNPDFMEDDWYEVNTRLTVDAYPICVFDQEHRGRLCIDLRYGEGPPEVDGRDEDGDGLLDWIDANQDGDTDDVISIDEALCVYWDDFYDDEIAELMDKIGAGRVVVMAGPCYSGGFIEDLSGPGRIVCTSTTETAVSYGNFFLGGLIKALSGNYSHWYSVDTDSNGYVSIVEAFNFAGRQVRHIQTAQYDDDGDGVPHAYPIPNGCEGLVGALTYLCDTCSTTVCPDDPCARRVALLQNRPNPFSDETKIQYWLPGPSRVTLSVYDAQGRSVAELTVGEKNTGAHTLSWRGLDREGRSVPSGVYFYKLAVDGYRPITKKLVVFR